MNVYILIIVIIIISCFLKKMHMAKYSLQVLAFILFFENMGVYQEFRWFFIVFLILGFIIAQYIIKFLYLLIFKIELETYKKISIVMIHVITVIIEESIWRIVFMYSLYHLIYYFLPIGLSWTLSIMIESCLFVLIHKINSVRDFIEMYIFTIILSISQIFLPYFNWGLHLGRNCYIETLNKKMKLQSQK